jgi:hypothetical protein
MIVTTTITIERDGVESEAEVHFEYHRASRGERDSCCGVAGAGPALEPDSAAELEFFDAIVGGVEVDLTQKEQDQAEQLAWDEILDAESDYEEWD